MALLNLLAATSSLLNGAACLLLGGAAGLLAWTIVSIITQPRPELDWQHRFEAQRRQKLREKSLLYKLFEPLIDELARMTGSSGDSARKLQHAMKLTPDTLPWTVAEFRAKHLLEGVLAGLGLTLLFLGAGLVWLAVIVALPIMAFYGQLAQQTLVSKGEQRMARIRHRLPFVVDLVALMMEAGAGFQDALRTAVRESRDHPLGEELGEVLEQISHGRPRAAALETLKRRLSDDDISEMVFAINKGEELGTPLSRILRKQADQMRLKRSQWSEKAAAQAQVKIVFPGVLVMVACLLVVITPIILPAVMTMFE